MITKVSKLFIWWPTIIWAAFILLAATIPGKDIPSLEVPFIDLIFHIAVYTVLSMLLYRSIINHGIITFKKSIYLFTLIPGFIYGIFTEMLQFFVPSRYVSVSDLLGNITGVLAGFLLARVIYGGSKTF